MNAVHATDPDPADSFTDPFTDAELLDQPMGYWTGAASESIVAHINRTAARFGLAQRHWWVLYRVGAAEQGIGREEVVRLIAGARPFVDASVLNPAIDGVRDRGLLTETDGRLHLTAEGRELRDHLAYEAIPATLAEVRAGITDEEYVTTLRVLRRMIANTGGDTSFTP